MGRIRRAFLRSLAVAFYLLGFLLLCSFVAPFRLKQPSPRRGTWIRAGNFVP